VTNRGWSTDGLPAVGDDPTLWTAAEAAVLLGPPELPVERVRSLIRLTGIQPVGKRRNTVGVMANSGRHARVYRADDLIRAYEALHGVGDQPSAPS
jgi:hypothetical protein